MKDRRKYNKMVRNSFCPTGPGGGVDPTCGAYSVSELNDAIQDYGELSHEQVNDHMRLTKRFKGVAASDARDTANKIAAAFHTPKIVRTTAKTEIVHRGIGNNRVYQSMRKLKVGDVVSDKAFLSTSKSPDIAQKAAEQNYSHQIIMRIVLPKGTKYLAGRSDEKELILQSGLPLKITKIDHAAPGSGYKHGTLYIDAEVSKSPRKTTNNVQNLTCNKRSNPLRFDPTRTTTLRRAFVGKLRRKFALLRKAIYDLLVVEDAIGLKKNLTYNHIEKLPSGKYRLLSHTGKNLGTFDSHDEAAKHEGEVEYFKHVSNERWRFNTTPEQLEAFKEWLKTQVDYYVTGMTDEELWRKFIESGFKKGAGRAFDDTKPQLGWTEAEGAFYAGTKDQFLKSAFGQPESLSKVQLLAARTFDELEGMSADMQNKLGRILVDGLTKGNGPISIAREMSNQLNMSMTRAETIARTELIRAHAEGQLVGMEELGVDEVGVMVEWSTAGDDRVCELCEPMEGVVLKIEEARGMIPRHPNCRCAFVPANVAEPTDDQKRGKRKIMSAVRTSAALGKDDFSTAVPVTKERPKSVLPVIANAFCPTGPGGGQDNSCSSVEGSSGNQVKSVVDEVAQKLSDKWAGKKTTLDEEGRKGCNEGGCEDIANRLSKKLPGSKLRWTEVQTRPEAYGVEGHVWVEYKGKHYDVENPEGVDDPKDLKFFKRYGMKEKPTRNQQPAPSIVYQFSQLLAGARK